MLASPRVAEIRCFVAAASCFCVRSVKLQKVENAFSEQNTKSYVRHYHLAMGQFVSPKPPVLCHQVASICFEIVPLCLHLGLTLSFAFFAGVRAIIFCQEALLVSEGIDPVACMSSRELLAPWANLQSREKVFGLKGTSLT